MNNPQYSRHPLTYQEYREQSMFNSTTDGREIHAAYGRYRSLVRLTTVPVSLSLVYSEPQSLRERFQKFFWK